MRTFSCFVSGEDSAKPTLSLILAESEQRALELARRELMTVCDASMAELREGGKLLWIEAVRRDGSSPPPRGEGRKATADGQSAHSMARILLVMAGMFENEKLRLVQIRLRARGNRVLLARIDRALKLLTLAPLSNNGDRLAAAQDEIDALAEEVDRPK